MTSSLRAKRGIEMRNVWIAVGINAALLALIGLLWAVWNSRRPMTAARLRKALRWDTLPPSSELPCGGKIGPAAALLRAAGEGGEDTAVLAALLLRWQLEGRISMCMAPKKKLRSFGADEQPQLTFLENSVRLDGAEAHVFEMLRGWAVIDGTMQQSELYQAARADAAAVDNRMTQLRQEGVRALREMGGAFLEGKMTKFGFSREAREIYTAKGVRLAREIAGYQKFSRGEITLSGEAAVMAVLVGAPEAAGPHAALCQTLAKAILDGAEAGTHVKRS